MATQDSAVQVAYVSGNSLPASPDQNTIYFVAGAKQLYVGNALIADSVDLTDEFAAKQDNITVTTSGSGDYIANVEWDSSTSTFTVTKSTLPTITFSNTGSGGIVTSVVESNGTVTITNTNTLASGTVVEAAPTTAMGVANKGYVDDAVAGLSGAMHYRGAVQADPTVTPPTLDPAAASGDVVTYGNNEYVFDGTSWRILGDEGSYALKTTQVSAGTGLTGGGALSSDVTISHGTLASTGTADDITADSTGHLYVMTGVDKDSFGHVVSVNEKDIYSDVEAIAEASVLKWTVVS